VSCSPLTTLFVLLTGVYGGYFGAGAGVMMIAILALGLDIDFRVVGALRTTSVMASNVVAGAVFAVVAEVDWAVVALLAVSSVGGGYLGATDRPAPAGHGAADRSGPHRRNRRGGPARLTTNMAGPVC
jgi:uncharacterized membrane protein YfcA